MTTSNITLSIGNKLWKVLLGKKRSTQKVIFLPERTDYEFIDFEFN